ncbi:MAG: MarR family transcriptional regulator [Acetatifactor sp.]|nr:MarR family transcriptional regulator [Acetatifactor sp.]
MDGGKRKFHIGHHIRKLDNMLKRNMQLALSGQGVDEVTAMNGFIIQYLHYHADQVIYQRDIEREFKIGRSAVTNILTRMEENGFIHRETDGGDARLKRLTLTDKGEEQSQLLHDTIEWLNRRQLDGIPVEEQEQFFATLEKIEGNAGRLAACILGEDSSWIREIRPK